MFRGLRVDSAFFTAALLVVVVVVIHQPQMLKAMESGSDEHHCEASSCGHIHNISYPFRLDTDPPSCGDSSYELHCESNATLVLYLKSTKYHVQAINYENYTIRLVDAGVFGGSDQYCSSFPPYPLTYHNFSLHGPYRSIYVNRRSLTLINCGNRMKSFEDGYVDYSVCVNNKSSSSSSSNSTTSSTVKYSYVKVGYLNASDVMGSCRIEQMGQTALWDDISWPDISLPDLHTALLYGFELSWYVVHCGNCSTEDCYYLQYPGNRIICGTDSLVFEEANRSIIACPALRNITVGVFFPFPKLADFRWLLYPDYLYPYSENPIVDYFRLLLSYRYGSIMPYYTSTRTANGLSSRCGKTLLIINLWFFLISLISGFDLYSITFINLSPL